MPAAAMSCLFTIICEVTVFLYFLALADIAIGTALQWDALRALARHWCDPVARAHRTANWLTVVLFVIKFLVYLCLIDPWDSAHRHVVTTALVEITLLSGLCGMLLLQGLVFLILGARNEQQ